jgi:hypothetical protein
MQFSDKTQSFKAEKVFEVNTAIMYFVQLQLLVEKN